MQKKIRIEINLLIFDTKLSFNAYPNAFLSRRGVCVMLVARLCQDRALVFKRSFNLFLAIQNLIMLFSAQVV